MQTSCIKDANKRHESAEGTLKRRDWPGTTLEQDETSIVATFLAVAQAAVSPEQPLVNQLEAVVCALVATLKVTMREETPLRTALMGVRLSVQLTEGAKLPLEPQVTVPPPA